MLKKIAKFIYLMQVFAMFCFGECKKKEEPSVEINSPAADDIVKHIDIENRWAKASSVYNFIKTLSEDKYAKLMDQIKGDVKVPQEVKDELEEVVKRNEKEQVKMSELTEQQLNDFSNNIDPYMNQLILNDVRQLDKSDSGSQMVEKTGQMNLSQILATKDSDKDKLEGEKEKADYKDKVLKEIQNFANTCTGFALDYKIIEGLSKNLLKIFNLNPASKDLGDAIVEESKPLIIEPWQNSSTENPFNHQDVVYYGGVKGNDTGFFDSSNNCENIYEKYISDIFRIGVKFNNAKVNKVTDGASNKVYPPTFVVASPINCTYKDGKIVIGGDPGTVLIGKDGKVPVP